MSTGANMLCFLFHLEAAVFFLGKFLKNLAWCFYLIQPKLVSESLGISICNVLLALFNLSILLNKFLFGKDQLNIVKDTDDRFEQKAVLEGNKQGVFHGHNLCELTSYRISSLNIPTKQEFLSLAKRVVNFNLLWIWTLFLLH